jgi:hypothetical protein
VRKDWIEEQLLDELQSKVLRPDSIGYVLDEFGSYIRSAFANLSNQLAQMRERKQKPEGELRRLAATAAETGPSAFLVDCDGQALPGSLRALNRFAWIERIGKRKRKRSNSRTGVFRRTYQRYLESLGWRWISTMRIGSGCQVHLRASELPQGPLLVKVSRHLTAVIDGVIYDTHDCSRAGTRCVYGYFSLSNSLVSATVLGRRKAA